MEPLLLATKVKIPQAAGQTIQRPRLVQALEEGLAFHKLVLLSAPAGYGKTTLLSQWARTSQYPVGWLSLSQEDNNLERFLRYCFQAWEQVQPEIRGSVLGVMLEGGIGELQPVLAAFINLANETPGHTALVLDDLHLVEEASIYQALAYLLDNLPQSLHFVLSTRAEPALPLARYRARAELLELRTQELKFNPDEAGEFFARMGRLDLEPAEIEKLRTQTEGWAAGLRLVQLAYRDRDGVQSLPDLTGKQRFVADYLSQEVLAGLPADLQSFLLETSILSQLSGSLCEAVTGMKDGQAVLERLEAENLFVTPLDDQREWYRYHGLFAGFLQRELGRRMPEKVAELNRTAAGWHLERDLPEPAFQHALAAQDLQLMSTVFGRYANAKLLGGELSDLKRWIDALPAEWFSAYPALNLARAGYLAYTGSVEASREVVDRVEKILTPPKSEDTRWQLARVKAVRCFMACMGNNLRQAESFAGQALENLPEADLGFRPAIYAALGDSYRQNGLWEEARKSYLKALDFTHSPPVRISSAHLYGALADLELRQGRLRSAAGFWEKALRSIRELRNWASVPLAVTGWVYTRRAELLYEWNELDAAWQHLSHGLERAEMGGDLRTRMAAYLLAARINLARGEIEPASGALAQAAPLIEQAPYPEWAATYERLQLDLWLAQKRLKRALSWVDEILESGALDTRPESEPVKLGIARILIELGDPQALGQAKTRLDGLLASVESEGRAGLVIETLALGALGSWRQGDAARAMSLLERSLRSAEPEGFLRLFVDLGPSMGRLLQEASKRGVRADYVSRILEAFGGSLPLSSEGVQALPEPLTPREQEILELLAAGLTNREIALRAVISPETVKKHVASICGKLGAGNRTEAVARAREAGWLA